MSEWSGFFNAVKVGEDWDRTYLAKDFANFFSPLIKNGVFAGRSNSLQVIPTNPADMSVQVSSGQAWISGYSYINDEALTVTIDPADGALNRIDLIVVQWSNEDREIKAAYKKGTAAVNAIAPSVQNDDNIKELCLAEIDVLAGLTSIKEQHIRDTRTNTDVCGWVTALIEQADTSTLYTQWEAKAKEVLDAINKELEDLKSDSGVEFRKLQFTNVSVPVASFSSNSGYPNFPIKATIPLSGVTSSMIPEVMLGIDEAASGDFSATAESYNGGIYLYSSHIPSNAITIPTIILWRGNT